MTLVVAALNTQTDYPHTQLALVCGHGWSNKIISISWILFQADEHWFVTIESKMRIQTGQFVLFTDFRASVSIEFYIFPIQS